MSGSRIVLITGSNAGLGLEIVKAVSGSQNEYVIIMAGRSLDKVSSAIQSVKQLHPDSKSEYIPLALDIESDDSISEAAAFVDKTYGHLDVLINNAGAAFDQAYNEGSSKLSLREVFNKSWDVNVTGTHLLTVALVPFLIKSSKPYLLFITSGTCSLSEVDDTSYRFNQVPPAGLPKPPGILSYRSSKTGLNMIMRDWHRVLKNDGVLVYAISPGFLATGLGGNAELLKKMGALDPSIGGHFIKDVVEGKRDEFAGKVIRKDAVQPW